jgi:hypothetical protein
MRDVKEMMLDLLAKTMDEKDDLMNQNLPLAAIEKQMYILQGKVEAYVTALENVELLETINR